MGSNVILVAAVTVALLLLDVDGKGGRGGGLGRIFRGRGRGAAGVAAPGGGGSPWTKTDTILYSPWIITGIVMSVFMCMIDNRDEKNREGSQVRCHLCASTSYKVVKEKEWKAHADKCGKVHSRKLKSMPLLRSDKVRCFYCQGKLRKLDQLPMNKLGCHGDKCVTKRTLAGFRANGRNMFFCYPCRYHLCLDCVSKEMGLYEE